MNIKNIKFELIHDKFPIHSRPDAREDTDNEADGRSGNCLA
jgi:hypothetical protein